MSQKSGLVLESSLQVFFYDLLQEFNKKALNNKEITKDIIPIKILQYLSSSLPVVSTPLPDVVNHFPVFNSGVVYSQTDNVSDFMQTILTTIQNETLEMLSRNARQFVSTHYSMDTATNHLVKILSES